MARINPFDKFLTAEQRLHRACCDWMDYQYPEMTYTHPLNEAKRTPFERFLAKILRMKPGVLDILIFNLSKANAEGIRKYNGLAIELKIDDKKPTKEQQKWLKDLAEQGWKTCVLYTTEEYIDVVNNYMRIGI